VDLVARRVRNGNRDRWHDLRSAGGSHPLGYHVIINSRYEKQETIFGFPTVVRLGVRCCHASDDPCGGLRRPRNCVASD
jgi:hypothetical protein